MSKKYDPRSAGTVLRALAFCQFAQKSTFSRILVSKHRSMACKRTTVSKDALFTTPT